ncbi:unnamed protein product [Ceutorhynchus assimilis]|uniref:Uncharacterized protein n=1 Tax=Ceutorhynchus assimilis TaxID=467358 RepID=A0A9N9QMK2_9CUCU|nr:unnamed protein product [Ceutorhynchus assimilis]
MLERDFYMYILSFVFYMMAFCGVLLVIRLIMFAYCLWETKVRKTMISEAVVVGAIVSVILCALLSTCIIFFSIKKDSRLRRRTNQRQHRVVRAQLIAQPDQNSVYSISGRLQNHQHSDPYLSIDHIAITNELNKPPKYDDAPPSYDEALKLALSNSLQTNEVVAALPNRTN